MFKRAGALCIALMFALGATTAVAAAGADIQAKLEFGKPHYFSHETMHVKLTVTNAGDQPAEGVKLAMPMLGLIAADTAWAPFDHAGSGTTLAPGESRTVEVAAERVLINQSSTELVLTNSMRHNGNPNGIAFSAKAAITPTTGVFSGVVYADKNRDGRQDAGEALAGAEVRITRESRNFATRTTDADGRFTFDDVPGGTWHVRYTLPDGWVVRHTDGAVQRAHMSPDAPATVSARAERPVSESLKAAVTFDRAAYLAGSAARVTVALTNVGDRPITGVQAVCYPLGRAGYLNVGPEWGDLVSGVTVGPEQTRLFNVLETVPAEAVEHGVINADCRFAPQVVHNNDGAVAAAKRRVIGGYGTVTAQLLHDQNAVPGVRLVLRSALTGENVSQAVSDAQGVLRFNHVPAGPMLARVDGPWQFAGDAGVDVITGRDSQRVFFIQLN